MATWPRGFRPVTSPQLSRSTWHRRLLTSWQPGTVQHIGTCAIQVCMACWWLLTALGISYRTVTLTSVSMTMSHSLWDSGGVGLGRRHNSPYHKGTLLTFSFFGSPKTSRPAFSSFRLCSLLPTQTLYCAGCMLDREAQPLLTPQCVLPLPGWHTGSQLASFSMQGLAGTYHVSLKIPHSHPVHWPLCICSLNTQAHLVPQW